MGAICSVTRFFAVFAVYVVDVIIQKWCFITTNVSYTFISFANLENLYDILRIFAETVYKLIISRMRFKSTSRCINFLHHTT